MKPKELMIKEYQRLVLLDESGKGTQLTKNNIEKIKVKYRHQFGTNIEDHV